MTPFNIWIAVSDEPPDYTDQNLIHGNFKNDNLYIVDCFDQIEYEEDSEDGGDLHPEDWATHWMKLRANTYREQVNEDARQAYAHGNGTKGLRTDTREGQGKGDL